MATRGEAGARGHRPERTRCMDPDAARRRAGPGHARRWSPFTSTGGPRRWTRSERPATACRSSRTPPRRTAPRLDGRRTGTLGTAAAFSFYPTKNLGALGDGGAVVTTTPSVADVLRSLRHHGSRARRRQRPRARRLRDAARQPPGGAAARQAARAWTSCNEARREAAARYREALAGLPLGLPARDDPRRRRRSSTCSRRGGRPRPRDARRCATRASGPACTIRGPRTSTRPWSDARPRAGRLPGGGAARRARRCRCRCSRASRPRRSTAWPTRSAPRSA